MITKIKKPTRDELIERICPDEFAEDEKLFEAFTTGFKKASKIKKMEQNIKVVETSNPKMAERLKGKLAALKGRKD